MKLKKTVLITGASGFVGTFVKECLTEKYNLLCPSSKELNLLSQIETLEYFETHKIDCVIHLAAVCGGIGANQKSPASFFYANSQMSLNILFACAEFKIKKLVTLGSVCSYPKYTTVPFKEENLWDGYPEETNAPYGIAKKNLLIGCKAFNQQYGSNFIHLIPVNMYGEHDNFDPESSHVIPALFNKFIEAKKDNKSEVTVWGDGSASREFLHARDCARAIHLALESYDKPDPINIGTGEEITIKDLALLIKKIVGYKGDIVFDKSKPNGQPRRCLNTEKAEQEFGFRAEIKLEKGLEDLYNWIINE